MESAISDRHTLARHPSVVTWNAGASLLLGLLLTLLGLTEAPRAAEASAEQTVFRVGVVPQFESRRIFSTWRPLLDELARRTGYSFELAGSPKIPIFEREVNAGQFDLAYMSPYHLMLAHRNQAYEPILRRADHWLQGILVVRNDSPIQSLDELSGQRIAVPSPNALGASLLMRAELAGIHGIKIETEVVQTHTSVYLHVAKNLTPAGGGVVQTLETQPQALRDQLRILYRTRKLAPHPLGIHPRVGIEVRRRIIDTLLAIAEDPATKPLLDAVSLHPLQETHMEEYLELEDLELNRFYINPAHGGLPK